VVVLNESERQFRHDGLRHLPQATLMRAFAFILLMFAAPAWASVPPSIVYVSTQPGMNKALAAAVVRGTYKAAISTFGASLIVNWRALGKRPAKAFADCGSDLSCLAKLADKLKADRILYGRVAPAEGGGAMLQMLVIGAVSETVEQRFSVVVQKPREAANTIGAQLAALDSAEGLSAPPDSETALAAPAPPVAAQAPADPAAPAMDFGGEPAAEPAPVSRPTVARPAAVPAPVLIAAPRPARAHPWLLPTSLVTTGVGLGAIGIGCYFGAHQEQLMRSIHYGAGGTTQSQAVTITKQANQDAVMADALFIAGGVVAALGLSLLGVSFF
jgi:hypothetical protein